MPPARATDSFVWRAAARPQGARLLGAIAIAVSCGGLGIVAGRWSAQVAPGDARTRTAALIEAVVKETRAKPAAEGGATADPAPVAPIARAPEAKPSDGGGGQAEPSDGGGQAALAPAAGDPGGGEEKAAEPPLAVVRPSTTAAAAAAQAEASRAIPAPALRRSQPAPTVEDRPTAPNYRALREYVLSR